MFLPSRITKLKKLDKIFLLLTCFTIFWAWVFLTLAFAKYEGFFTGFRDLGIYDQAVSNTSHGKWFKSSLDFLEGAQKNILAQHAEIILLFLAPIYLILPTPKVLIFLQIVLVFSTSLPLYSLAKMTLRTKVASLILSISFLLYAPIEWAVLFEFHPVTLALPFLIWGYWFLKRKHIIGYFLLLMLSLATKEIVGIATFLFGMILTRQREFLKIGKITALISALWLIITLGFIIPSLNGKSPHPLLSYFSNNENSYGKVVQSFFTQDKLLNVVSNKENARYLSQLLLPIAFFPILSPLWILPIIPELSLLLLAIKPEMKLINFHYASLPTAFFFLAILNVLKIFKKRKIIFGISLGIIFASSLITNYWYSPSPLSKRFEKPPYLPNDKSEKLKRLLSEIPHNKSVTTTQRLGSHLSQRENLFIFPSDIFSADYVILDTINFPSHPWLIAVYQENREEVISTINKLKNNHSYSLKYQDSDIVIFIKRSSSL